MKFESVSHSVASLGEKKKKKKNQLSTFFPPCCCINLANAPGLLLTVCKHFDEYEK